MWKWEAETDDVKGCIVIVHGAAEHHGRYKMLVEMWRLAGYHVVIGDLPGQGTTTRRRGHIESFDEYIKEVNEWITEAKKFGAPLFLLGHSMGGLIVIRALQEKHHDVKAVILSSPCLGILFKPNKALELASRGLNLIMPSFKVQSQLNVGLATRSKAVQELDENDSLYVTKVSVRWYRELIKAMEEAQNQVGKFQDVPLLLMQGGADKIVDKSLVKAWFNKVDLHEKNYKEWKGLYHEIFNEPEQEIVFETAKRFFDAHSHDQK
ncbi:alpha/beta hydrolase [Metabacillus endolithicus]|uniref:Alpha/beta hydrolase n=1 Tax=Metabacillus endolithicus TaxID=1535204 RepID=A0ABW5BTV1_9BACI|nr:alpha/beta hydrolase [Metabacillus endolithicus]UPG64886.1 alpha/beta hydrolase [Metabacillus endolithicus]